MDILIIGGSNFVGYHVSDAVLERGYNLTLFNRGQSNPNVFPQAEKIIGDREGDLAVLKGRQWDAVVDTCGYLPRIVRKSAEMLKDSVGYYHFVSSIGVYPETEYGRAFIDENTPLATIADPTSEEMTLESYGALKVLCENAVQERYPNNFSVARPGLIVGPHDFTDRLNYWAKRVAKGGPMLAPGKPDTAFQAIDARDLANFILTLIENQTTGIYNAVGPAAPTTWASMLETCKTVTGSDAEFVWLPDEFLQENVAHPSFEIPLWRPVEMTGINRVRYDHAVAVGLKLRPLADTVRDTLTWDATRPPASHASPFISAEREAELLAAWQTKVLT